MRPVKPTPLQISLFDSCESTNQLLLAAAESGAPAGTVYVARAQTAGRGRRGRSWVAEPGKTLAFSLLWCCPVDPASISGLSLVIGVAITRALEHPSLGKCCSGMTLGLKWPNDLLLRSAAQGDAKVGGILIESVARKSPDGSRELAVVIGIGLNCLASDSLRDAVADQSIAALSECFVESEWLTPERLLPVMLAAIQEALLDFSNAGFGALRQAWERAHLWQGETVRITEADSILLEGLVQGVDRDGALLIATSTGVERVMTGDVSLRKV